MVTEETPQDGSSRELKMSHTGPDGGLHFWLIIGGIPVAYAKIYEKSSSFGTIVDLCDIETREEYRNRGYATELLSTIAQGYGVLKLSHRGSYTADGFSYIAPKLNRIGEPARGPSHGPMRFVSDWATLTTEYL